LVENSLSLKIFLNPAVRNSTSNLRGILFGIEMKICKKCKLEKELTEFRKEIKGSKGVKSTCKFCDKAARDLKKPIKETPLKKSQEEIIEARRNYYKSNKEKLNKYSREYRLKNKDKIKVTRNKYQKKRLSEDFVYSFKFKINSSIRKSFKKRDCIKSKRTEEILGCTITEFIEYISSKFTEGMTLENYGEWHFDHIIPISSAKIEEDVIRLNHYTNLQPLWAEDNLRKGVKIF
jgi:hypothetical protein